MAWPTFWVEETGDAEVSIRRYSTVGSCLGRSCHDASVVVGRKPLVRSADGNLAAIGVDEYGDARWPHRCSACDYEFGADDKSQVVQEPIMRRTETGEEWPQRRLPPGAMFDAVWYRPFGTGPDGLALVVVLPPEAEDNRINWWHVDGPAGSDRRANAWTRTGDPRAHPSTVDVTPSILTPYYHGYLRQGTLTDPL